MQPEYLIRRLHQRSTAEFASAVDDAGITQVQLSILLAVEHVSNVAAEPVPAGTLSPAGRLSLTVPALCRVTVIGTPTPDSRIGFEVRLPGAAAWNGKLLGVGNGGYSSVLDYKAMADGLRAGYAVVATDGGHTGEDLQFMIGHPGKVEDWADRAVHVMTEQAKRIVRAATSRLPDGLISPAAPRAASRVWRRRSAIPTTTTASSPGRPATRA